ncbi:hypothetical protein BRARA_K00102 [Brassica rapa]|uniref:RNase H type-1 domain-containing protein n=1 Tax=Brassica campestris TaxID=3711 RepID=A0A397L9G3_BRACM|nr:hypothetical protein BRARA_K00102 [Brassica rapa]
MSCSFADEVWELAPLAWKPGATIPSLATMLSHGSKIITLPPVGIFIPLWPWLLWNLWKARNKLYFDGRSFSAQEVLQKSIADAKEWQTAQAGDSGARSLPRHHAPPSTTVHALPTEPACFVDAAWSSTTGSCGIRGVFKGVIRPHIPDICSSRRLVSSALMAEAIAIRSAVMLAASSNLRSLQVFSDSQTLVSMVKAKESRPVLFGILFDIYHFSCLFDTISFSFIPRLQNFEADLVAKSALALADRSSDHGV